MAEKNIRIRNSVILGSYVGDVVKKMVITY